MARVLIVGCGCRGRALAGALAAEGHAVRGTTRDATRLAEIESVGAEAVPADPVRLATLLPALEGVSALCWLMGTADAPSLHGPVLATLLEHLVDTPVRGVVYEPAGGEALVREAGQRWRLRVEVLEQDPAEHEAWLDAATAAVGRLLG